MAAKWIYHAFVTCLMLCFTSQSIDAIDDFHFDDRSCDSLLPQTDAVTPGRQNNPSRESSPEDVFPKTDRKSPQNALVASNEEAPPYKIVTSQPPFSEEDKLFTVTLQGDGFNGFIIQARALQGTNKQAADLGRFINLPTGVKFLECGPDAAFRTADTVISTDTSLKKSVKLTWRSESGHLKNMLFVATFVKNNTYWPNVKTNPLYFRTPPDFNICGKATSCFRYSGTSEACVEDKCNFVFTSELGDGEVAFILGAILTEPTGYIGVAFSNEKFGKLELFACVLGAKERLKANYYVATDIESQPEKEPMLNQMYSSTSLEPGAQTNVWCHFIRKLKFQGSQLSDFGQPQTMMFLRGPLQNSTGVFLPQLGNSSVFAQHPWSATAMVDSLVTAKVTSAVQPPSKPDGVSKEEPLIVLTFVSIAVTLFHAAAS